jgi:DNA topoisomerase-1
MLNNHVKVSGSQVRFQFRGKSGKHHTITLSDRRLARIVKRCRELPGHELFTYTDDDGEIRRIDSDDVNEYLRVVTGEDFTAKDFRTWGGTVLAATALVEPGEEDCEEQAKSKLTQAIESVAAMLGNTPTVCRKCYIHPAVIEAYTNGLLPNVFEQYTEKKLEASSPHELHPEEAAVVSLLEQSIAAEEQKSAA